MRYGYSALSDTTFDGWVQVLSTQSIRENSICPSFIQWFWQPLMIFFFFVLPLYCCQLPAPSCTHAQSCNPMHCSPPGSSVHGLFQARVLEWVAATDDCYLNMVYFLVPEMIF